MRFRACDPARKIGDGQAENRRTHVAIGLCLGDEDLMAAARMPGRMNEDDDLSG